MRFARTMDLDEVLESLGSELQLDIAGAARRRLLLHAGVPGWRGRAIVMRGLTLTGKTMLMAALERAGATDSSDEYAAVESPRARPPLPETAVAPGGSRRPTQAMPAGGVGWPPGDRPLPVGIVVITQYRPGARRRPRGLSPGEAVPGLLSNTESARRQPALALQTVPRVISRALA